MVKSSTGHEESALYGETIERIEAYIQEADTVAFSKPLRLQEIATEIHRLSALISYEKGMIYAHYYTGRILHKQAEFEKALPYYHVALEFFEQRSESRGVVMCLHQLGLVYQSLSQYAEALEHFQRELEVVQRSGSGEERRVAMIGASIATVHLLTGQYDTALQQFMAILRIVEKHEDEQIRAGVLNNIATIYTLMGDNEQGMEYLQKTLAIWREQGARVAETNTLLNIGWNYLQRGLYEQALENSVTVLQLCRELGERKREAVVLLHLGQAHSKLQQFDKAHPFFLQSKTISDEVGDRRNSADVAQALGDMFSVLGDRKQAKTHYEDALSIVREIGLQQAEYELYEALAHIEKEEGNALGALEYYEQYMRTKEEVLNEHRRKAIREIQVRFNVEQAQKEKEGYRLKSVELAEALEEVKILNHYLLDANNEKNELLGIVAHDLKNPISGLSMGLSLLGSFREQMPSHKVGEQIMQMAATVQRMEHIVARLLEVNRLDSGKLPLEMVVYDLRDIVHYVVGEYKSRGHNKNIAVEYVSIMRPLYVVLDRDATMGVLDNIISNAVKYSPHHSTVHVRLAIRDTMAVCEVQDQGPGINPSDMDKLFKKFSRLQHRPTGGESSTGLGLWIVKKLVESMGGSVECESEVGKGSTFRVLLPLSAQQEVIRE